MLIRQTFPKKYCEETKAESSIIISSLRASDVLFIYLVFYVAFNSLGHIATGSLQVEETSAYCTVNHWASASNYQLSNMKHQARDWNQRPQRLDLDLFGILCLV